jgi:2-keto-4-pentenoate hydratase/2-oxohepta-3-ene-1,7-dioic acid hydratase in catechol pathway
MHWRFEQMIAHASRGERIRAGEVFGSGTVGGGSGMEQDRKLAVGDVIELEVERLGLLRNRIVAPTTRSAS